MKIEVIPKEFTIPIKVVITNSQKMVVGDGLEGLMIDYEVLVPKRSTFPLASERMWLSQKLIDGLDGPEAFVKYVAEKAYSAVIDEKFEGLEREHADES